MEQVRLRLPRLALEEQPTLQQSTMRRLGVS